MLHSGHVAFLNEAATYGDELYVAIGSDNTIGELKGRKTINSEDERQYLLQNLKCVTQCLISRGTGYLDFVHELKEIKPAVLIVNEDGNSPEKERLCKKIGIEYIILKRIPYANLPPRTTTDIRTIVHLPYRIDIAGTWIDQPYVSKYHAGGAIVCSLEPTVEFNERSGMASSTRKKARDLWPMGLPLGKPEELAKMLFRWDNPPGQKEISGSQDALGMVLPGINFIFYNKEEYWPSRIDEIHNEDILTWLEERMYFTFLWPRPEGFNVLKDTHINNENVKKLATAAENCWNALLKRDFSSFSSSVVKSFESQVRMFPRMLNDQIREIIHQYQDVAMGWKLSGAGGGGYLVLFSEKKVEGAFKVKIRRRNSNF